MALRRILTVDNKADLAVLKTKSEPVSVVDDELQIGVPKRVIVMDLSRDETAKAPRYYVNPEIVWASEETLPYEEGCLSVPEIYDEVDRPAKVKLKYLDFDGNPVEEDAEGLYAVCIQHEMDHLEGVLFIDHLSRLKRERAVAKVKKAAALA